MPSVGRGGRDGRAGRRLDQRHCSSRVCRSCRSSSRSARWASRAGWRSTSPTNRRSTRPRSWLADGDGQGADAVVAARRARRLAHVRRSRSLMAFVLTRTVFGVHTYAIGSNEATARLCGIRVLAREGDDLRAGRPVRGPGRRHAVRAADGGRSDHGGRQGARRHRRGRDRRREPVGRVSAASPARSSARS